VRRRGATAACTYHKGLLSLAHEQIKQTLSYYNQEPTHTKGETQQWTVLSETRTKEKEAEDETAGHRRK
jgi:hypothetical protein